MSNLYKSGFQSLIDKNGEPFVLDVNSRKINTDSVKGRVIRPLSQEDLHDDKIKGEEVNQTILDDAFDKAKVLRDDAMIKAAQIVADANAEAEAIREQARQEGYDQGLEEGNMEASKRAEVYLENLQREQEALLHKKTEDMKHELEEAEKGMVDITCMLIEKLTGILVNDYKPVLLYMINNALSEAETSKKFVIKVSDQSYTYIYDNRDRLSGATNPSVTIEIFGDTKLGRDQCIIESDNGIIDLSMDVQVKNLITAIKLLS